MSPRPLHVQCSQIRLFTVLFFIVSGRKYLKENAAWQPEKPFALKPIKKRHFFSLALIGCAHKSGNKETLWMLASAVAVR